MYCIENCKKSGSNNPCRHLWMTTLEIARKYRFILFAWRQKVFHAPEKKLGPSSEKVEKCFYKVIFKLYSNSKNRKKEIKFQIEGFFEKFKEEKIFLRFAENLFSIFFRFRGLLLMRIQGQSCPMCIFKDLKKKTEKNNYYKKTLEFRRTIHWGAFLDFFVVTLCFLKDFMGDQRGGGGLLPLQPANASQKKYVFNFLEKSSIFLLFLWPKVDASTSKKAVAHLVFSLVHICLWKPR